MIKSLTSMRFFAALLVFIYHYEWLEINYSVLPLDKFWENLITQGALGVSFFYVLSGFVLTHAYQKRFSSSQIKVSNFYIARFARIYPLHFFTFLVSIPLMINSPWSEYFYPALTTNVSLTHSFVPISGYYFSFNSPSWSISNEFFFYALFPFLIQLNTKKLIIAFVLILSLIFLTWKIGQFIEDFKNYWYWTFYINPFFRLLEFIFGIWIYRIRKSHGSHLSNQGIWKTTLLEIFALLILVTTVYFLEYIPSFLSKGVIFAPIFGLIIMIYSFEVGLISKLISNKVFVYFGEISFSMYMLHQIFIRYLYDSPLSSLLAEYSSLGFFVVLTAVIFMSSFSFHFLEIPLNKAVKKKMTNYT